MNHSKVSHSNEMSSTKSDCALGIDISELIDRFQVTSLPMPRHNTPAWVFDEAFIRRLFPRDSRKWSRPVLNKAACLWWYWRCGQSIKDIAAQLDITTRGVELILQRITYQATVMMSKLETELPCGRLSIEYADQIPEPETILVEESMPYEGAA